MLFTTEADKEVVEARTEVQASGVAEADRIALGEEVVAATGSKYLGLIQSQRKRASQRMTILIIPYMFFFICEKATVFSGKFCIPYT